MIKGYETLSQEHKDLFDAFLPNFKRYGKITPVSVYYVEEIEFEVICGEDSIVIAGLTAIIHSGGHKTLFEEWSDERYPDYTQQSNYTSSRKFLRFDYISNLGPEWQHVISPTEWY